MVLCLFVPHPLPAAAEEPRGLGFWIEAQAPSRGPIRIIGSYEKALVGPLGISVTAVQESNGYREFYAGPTMQPLEWFKVGVGVGREHVPEIDGEESLNSTRYNAFFSITHKKIAAYGSFENGSGGPWHELRAVYNPTEKIGVGIMDEKNRGFGPRLELNLGKGVQLWGAVLRDNEADETTSVLAINYSF
jgi:hypothetical protein